jgi:hypothetical protein
VGILHTGQLLAHLQHVTVHAAASLVGSGVGSFRSYDRREFQHLPPLS